MRIHKEGINILVVSLAVTLGINLICYLYAPMVTLYIITPVSALLMLFLLRFFRVPSRPTSPDDKAIYSPADGKVVAIEKVYEDEALKTECLQISVFMSVWNIHINWFPTSGTIKYHQYHPGSYLVAWHPKSSTLNERTSIVIERPDGIKVLLRQIAGAVARRIVCYAKPEGKVEQFSELGFIKFGSRVDVFLPLNSEVKVKLGDKVKGNLSVLAKITES